MLHKFTDQNIKYDGSQLSSLWAFRNFALQGDSIVAFRGPCDVRLDHMVDLADVLNEESIYSREMLHFIIEHFDLDLEKTVCRQRLLICQIKEVIAEQTGIVLLRKGDDLYYREKKLSVSIATISPVSTMIHTGLNIISEGAPVSAVSLPELGINDSNAFAEKIVLNYAKEVDSIRKARCKVRGVL